MNKRILLVDDDEQFVQTLQSVLQDVGYSVHIAKTGNHALKKAKENSYDLAILDIKLPDLPGDEVASRLKILDDKMALILITGYPKFQESIDLLYLGIHEILLKPIAAAEIIRATNEAFSSSRPLNSMSVEL